MISDVKKSDLELLRTRLWGRVEPGPISDPADLEPLLVAAWDELARRLRWSSEAYKLLKRGLEPVTWEPPFLTFTIERHGGLAMGCVRGLKRLARLRCPDIRGVPPVAFATRKLPPGPQQATAFGLRSPCCGHHSVDRGSQGMQLGSSKAGKTVP